MAVAQVQGIRRFSLAGIAPQPWKNGGGQTREVGAGRLAAGEQEDGESTAAAGWDWRISVARITRPGGFSQFEGVERTAVLVAENPISLWGEAGTIDFERPGDVRCFPGEMGLHSVLPQGNTSLLNVMVRRGRAMAEVVVRQRPAVLALEAGAVRVLHVVSGPIHVQLWAQADGPTQHFTLQAGEGLQLCQPGGSAEIHTAGPHAQLIDISVRPPAPADLAPLP